MRRIQATTKSPTKSKPQVIKARFIRRFIAFALIGLAAFILVSVFFAWWFTGPQRRALKPIPADFGYTVESVKFKSTDGIELSGWFVPCAGAKQGVVLLHGNGSTRSQMIARAHLLRNEGYAVLLYDARGHGESDGRLVSVGWYETNDLLGALAFLRSKGCVKIGCIGASQGGATIALAAARLHDVNWVVLEAVYPDIRTALDRRFRHTVLLPGSVAGLLMTPLAGWRLGVPVDDIAPIKTIAQLPCPVLIMGGERDRHNLSADTLALFAAAREPKELWLVPNAAHVDLYGAAGKAYEEHLLAFVRKNSVPFP